IVHQLWLITEDAQAEPGQRAVEKSGAEDRHQRERLEVHAEETGRNRDEMPDARQQSRDEDAARPVLFEPLIRLRQSRRTEMNEAAVLFDERAAEFVRDPVAERGADPRPEGGDDDDEE